MGKIARLTPNPQHQEPSGGEPKTEEEWAARGWTMPRTEKQKKRLLALMPIIKMTLVLRSLDLEGYDASELVEAGIEPPIEFEDYSGRLSISAVLDGDEI